jgi:hypothetical protein
MTPLIIASVQGQKDIVNILLTHNAKIHVRDVKGLVFESPKNDFVRAK